MSDSYRAIVDQEATPDAAEALAQRVVERLQQLELIGLTLDPEAVLWRRGRLSPGRPH